MPRSTIHAAEPILVQGLRPWANLRWIIVGLIFTVTCINYIDRSSVGLLFTHFGPELGIGTAQYARVGAVLLLAYTISQAVSGRVFDRWGARVGFTVSIVVWCCAAMLHGAILGAASFAVCSFFLGLGEAGNWPGAAKVIAEWFPVRERALAMAIFNGGASLGGVVAPLLVAGWLDPLLGWRRSFVIVGALGFAWLAVWLLVYRTPAAHPRLSAAERALLEDGSPPSATVRGIAVREILRHRQTWGILLARFFVDPIWWLYMLWLPTYLKDARHFSLREIGASAWIPYLAAALGSLFGGWLSGRQIRAGWTVNRARKTVMFAAACLMPFGLAAARAHTAPVALACIAVVLFGFQMWISNVQTLPSDYFPRSTVGTVAGIGGMAAGTSSLIFNLCTGWMILHFGYDFVLALAGLLGPVGAVLLFAVAGPIERLPAFALQQR